jgi:signal transduction histidine kinase
MDRAVAPQILLLLKFGRLALEAMAPEALLRLMVETTVDPAGVGAAAAAALRVEADGRVRIVAAHGLPPSLADWSEELETLGAELGMQLRAVWGETSREVDTFALVSGGDVFGALVMFSAPGAAFDVTQGQIAEGLADLAAGAMDRAARYAALERSYAELRASREALAKGEKLRALGEMAAGISHDIKNILNPLALQVELTRRRLAGKPELALETLGHMDEAIRSGIDVVERLRAFSRQAPEAVAEAVDLNQALATAAELCRPRVKGRLQLQLEPGSAPPVMARRSELVTAVVNLVFNSLDAMKDEGRVRLASGAADGGAWIEVDDDGPGMPPEVEKRIFEPFFTTKESGTGLGLAMVYAFVKRHGGSVTLDTRPGAGTRFRLWFPGAA